MTLSQLAGQIFRRDVSSDIATPESRLDLRHVRDDPLFADVLMALYRLGRSCFYGGLLEIFSTSLLQISRTTGKIITQLEDTLKHSFVASSILRHGLSDEQKK